MFICEKELLSVSESSKIQKQHDHLFRPVYMTRDAEYLTFLKKTAVPWKMWTKKFTEAVGEENFQCCSYTSGKNNAFIHVS